MTNAIDMHSATRVFGRTTALDGVSFSVPEGSICGLLGRNGAGKTTIMSIIAGQDRPTSGRVEVLGHRPFENESVLSRVSFVRDNQRYPDNYQLRHVLRIAPEFAPNWNEDVAAELAEGFRIPTRTDIKKFSRGQLSSVAIILGLASRAAVTLLDEPYLGLDVTARALFHDMLLRDYTAHPRTVLLSTHLIEESERLFDRVVVIDRGRVRIDSDVDDARELAFTLSGTTAAVDQLAQRHTVLRSHTVSGLKSVTVLGTADEAVRADADGLGARLAPASLQDLVAAFGEEGSGSIEEGARA
ncbi:ABC transporter ATP-binding protein [Promicromonospora vindobonensis]|uniref:ABC transporter ATP-binding protein n=1 Tax=Promicromonospora vindobonensis TaxID=195748 RepID=A0ABW5VWR5_9MICO